MSLQALDKLNKHARAWEHGPTPRIIPQSAIYALKKQALFVLTAAGVATHRRVVYHAPCRNCGGSGWHRKDEGCWTCSGRGHKDLFFVESALPEGIIWHSPCLGVLDLWHAAGAPLHPCGDWRPLLPGLPIEAAAAVQLLNEAEDWLRPTMLVQPPYHLSMRVTDERWQEPALAKWLHQHPEQRQSHWWVTGDDIPF